MSVSDGHQVLRDQVRVLRDSRYLGAVLVSTSDVTRYPETALFFANDSIVVQSYRSWGEAITGHYQWKASPSQCWNSIVAHVSARQRRDHARGINAGKS